MRDEPLIITIDPAEALRHVRGSTLERLDIGPIVIPVVEMKAPKQMIEDLELNMSRGERRHGTAGRWRKKRLFRP